MFRYYSILRPIMPGSCPKKNVVNIVNFDKQEFCEDIGRKAWGYIEYQERLTEKDIDEYELISTELKTFWCVKSSVYNDGSVKTSMMSTKMAISKPENKSFESPLKDVYIYWFNSEEEAKEFVRDITN